MVSISREGRDRIVAIRRGKGGGYYRSALSRREYENDGIGGTGDCDGTLQEDLSRWVFVHSTWI